MNPTPRRTSTTRSLLLALLLGLALTRAPAAELGADLPGLLQYARANSPELSALRQEHDAAALRVQPAGALPDPVLRVELMNINNYGSDAGLNLLPSRVGETRYTVMQMLPAWGKRGLQRDAAQADAQQAAAQADAGWIELAAKIKTAYAQYYQAAGNERYAREVLDLMARLEGIAQARYAGGLAAQSDAVRAQLEQTAMRAELIALDLEKHHMRARLNTLLARDGMAPLAEPQALRPLPAANALHDHALAERALARNPLLQAEAAKLRAAQARRDLTLRNRWPDLQVGVVPTQMRNRITSWGLMFELNLPLQRQTRSAQEGESEAMLAAAQARSQALSYQLRGELAESLAGLDAARRSESLVTNQLLPQSELGLRSALAAYENGKVDFASLLDAQRLIRKARQDQLKAQVEAQLRLAEIERLVGEEL